MPIEDSKIRKISKKEEEEEETNGREIKDRRGGAKTRCRANRGTRGSRCNKASRERNTPRRQRLPLQLQSSSISRGRQIKLLTQYPLYPYNKNKYDRSSPELSSCYDFQVSLSSFVFFTPFATREGKNCWNGGRVYSTLSSSFFFLLLLLLFLERGCLRTDLNFYRNRNEEMFVINIIIPLKFTLDIFLLVSRLFM